MAKALKNKHPDFFKHMQGAKCSLITKHESHLSSNVDQQAANEFLEKAPVLMNGKPKPVEQKVANSKLDEIE